MDNAIADTLKIIGWDSGFRLPMANAENQALERELALLVIKKSAMTKEYEDVTERHANIQAHLKYVRQEAEQNQGLLHMYQQQLANESHKLKLKQSERDNINAEIRTMGKSVADIQERLRSKKLLLARNLGRLEKIKTEGEWDAQALKTWDESIKQRDANNELLAKFSKEDARKMVDLETKRKNLQMEVNERRSMLSQMEVDVSNCQQVLGRTGKMLADLKAERGALVCQWQESVRHLRQKDGEIARVHHRIAAVQVSIGEQREVVAEQEAFLANEVASSRQLRAQTEELRVGNQTVRDEYVALDAELQLLTLRQNDRQKEIQRTAYATRVVRMNYRRIQKQAEVYRQRQEKLENEIEKLQTRAAELQQTTGEKVCHTDAIERLIKEADRGGNLLQRRMQALLHQQYQINCANNHLTEIGDASRADVWAMTNAIDQVHKRTTMAITQLVHKKQLVSDLSMKVACVEAQLGNTDREELEQCQELWGARIAELEALIVQHSEIKVLLHAQILKLQKENLRLVNKISADEKLHHIERDKLQSLLLQIDGGVKQKKAATLRTQQAQVEENVLRLKVDKLQAALGLCNKEIYKLQRYTIDLSATLKERHVELDAALEVLRAKKKNVEEDRGRLRADIAMRVVRIQQQENKYALMLGTLGKLEGGEPMTVTAFKVRAAQERYELTLESEATREKVAKTEREIVAMENTLKIVNMTNQSFKSSLSLVNQESDETQELQELEEQLNVQLMDLQTMKLKLVEKVQLFNELKDELVKFEEVRKELNEESVGLEDVLFKLQKEHTVRQEKIERTKKQLHMCKKKISNEQQEKYDRDLYIKQLQDTNKNTLCQLSGLCEEDPDAAAIVNKELDGEQLESPKPRSQQSSYTSSVSILTPSSVPSSASTSGRSERSVNAANVTSFELKFDDLASGSSVGSGKSRDKK